MKTALYKIAPILVLTSLVCILPSSNGFAQNCPGLGTLTLNTLALPVPSINAPFKICPESSGTVSVAQTFSSYEWNTGATDQVIAISDPGTFSVTVTNAAGCTGTGTVVVLPLDVPYPQITETADTCNGQVVLSVGTGYPHILWSDGHTTNAITVDASNPYSVTVTNVFGCTATTTYDATILPLPTVNISGDTSLCNGASVNLVATASGATSYHWSTGQSGLNITVTAGGTYSFTATNQYGCSVSDSLILTEFNAVQPVINGPTILCDSASTTLSVANTFNNYAWDSGAATPELSVHAAGTYSVTVTDAHGCTGTGNHTITGIAAPNPVISSAPYNCNGLLSLDAGAGFASYAWSTSETGTAINVDTSGAYAVTVTNAQGCTGSNTFIATVPVLPSVMITGVDSICSNAATTLSVPSGFAQYLWNNGFDNSNLGIDSAGTYAVTVTDQFGCTASNSFNVGSLATPNPQINGPAIICDSTSTTLSVVNTFNSYAWDSGSFTSNLIVHAPGTYTVTVTDSHGCTGASNHTLTGVAAPNPVISSAPYNCNGLLSLDAGAGFASYAWSTNETGATINVDTSGGYAVTVTNAQGCTGSNTFIATVPALPSVLITGVDSICSNAGTTLSVPSGFVQYLWNNSSGNSSLSIDSAGIYAVTVTDQLGCTASNSFNVGSLSTPTPQINGVSQICMAGIATFSLNGIFSSYSWSTGATSSSITANTGGTYTVTVTAANGCTGSDTQTLTVGTNLQPQIIESPYACNGQISLDAGTGFSIYSWSSGQSTQGITTSNPGSYSVTVGDGNGCSGTAVVSVTIPSPPLVDILGDTQLCSGSTGDLTLNQTFSQYAWSTGAVTPAISINAGGIYTVTVTDNLGCTTTDTITVQETASPSPSANTLPYSCNGQLVLQANSGFNLYDWSGPNGFTETGQQAIITTNGTYSVVVTDANGCTGSATVVAAIPAQNTVALDGPTLFCAGGTVDIAASTGFVAYTWNDGSMQSSLSADTAGVYSVTATDAQGCTATATLSLGLFQQQAPVITGPTMVCPGSTATLSLSNSFPSIQWSDGSAGTSINAIPPFSASVTITDANGCTGTSSASVGVSNPPMPTIVELPYNCDHLVTLDAGAGFGYTWMGPNGFNDDNQQPNVTEPGTYSVTVTDAVGCSGTASIQVAIPTTPALAVAGFSPICPGQPADLSASSGFVSYLWSDGQSGSGIFINQPATYFVTATDNLGCTVSASFTVEPAPQLNPSINGNTSICPGSASVFEVPGNFDTYSWSNGASTAAISVTQAGSYTVTVTDAAGCFGSSSIQLEFADAPVPSIIQQPYHCDHQISLNAENGFVSYNWGNGNNTQSLNITQSGNYAVTVTNALGCSGSASIQSVLPPDPVVQISGASSLCDGNSTILNASGNGVTYQWSNGASGTTLGVSQAGTYTVTATDAFGCTATEMHALSIGFPVSATITRNTCRFDEVGIDTLTLTAANGCDSVLTIVTEYEPTKPGLELELPDVIETDLGQSIQINVGANFPIDSVAFQTPFSLSCTNCIDPSMIALAPGFILVEAFDPDGCYASREVRIRVKKEVHIYVPNVFYPGSNENGFFEVVTGPEVKAIHSFYVFDRWGNELFSRDDMPINQPGSGWDGSFRNQAMQPGVYVYYFDVVLVDDSIVKYSGGVTILK